MVLYICFFEWVYLHLITNLTVFKKIVISTYKTNLT